MCVRQGVERVLLAGGMDIVLPQWWECVFAILGRCTVTRCPAAARIAWACVSVFVLSRRVPPSAFTPCLRYLLPLCGWDCDPAVVGVLADVVTHTLTQPQAEATSLPVPIRRRMTPSPTSVKRTDSHEEAEGGECRGHTHTHAEEARVNVVSHALRLLQALTHSLLPGESCVLCVAACQILCVGSSVLCILVCARFPDRFAGVVHAQTLTASVRWRQGQWIWPPPVCCDPVTASPQCFRLTIPFLTVCVARLALGGSVLADGTPVTAIHSGGSRPRSPLPAPRR